MHTWLLYTILFSQQHFAADNWVWLTKNIKTMLLKLQGMKKEIYKDLSSQKMGKKMNGMKVSGSQHIYNQAEGTVYYMRQYT